MEKTLRYFWLWFALGAGMVVAIAYLSLMSHPPAPVNFQFADKVEHFLAYALLMIWFVQIFERRRHVWVLAALLLFSIIIEMLQGLSGFRSFDFWDIMANFSGMGLGWLLGGTRVAQSLAQIENYMNFQRKSFDDR